ncbi:hypothetical protein LCGC14_1484100 [marine sediment metagenome]|uniref:Uncharacterized protein n=1 Tax=marine sediment metagenome TaxID=412755 RepID=A0A0F9MAG2_9ZZZZ
MIIVNYKSKRQLKKACTKCGKKYPATLDCFYKDKSTKDGLCYRCKDCIEIYQRQYNVVHRQRLTDCGKLYRQTFAGKETAKKSCKKQRLKFPEKYKAKDALNCAVRYSKIKRSVSCEACGLLTKTEGHHPDYSKPLSVIWLCKKCHIIVHKN